MRRQCSLNIQQQGQQQNVRTCYRCGLPGHLKSDCPLAPQQGPFKGGQQNRPYFPPQQQRNPQNVKNPQARTNALVGQDQIATVTIIKGIILFFSTLVHVFIDSGSTHSDIVPRMMKLLGLQTQPLGHALNVI